MTVRQANAGIPGTLSSARWRIGAVVVVSVLSALGAAVAAPTDVVQGDWQRLMYVHVPAAWTAYLMFAVVLVASVLRLRGGSRRCDRCAQAAAEIGVVATALALLSGSVWGHAVWGVWWTWDARLVSTALMLVVYVGYLGLLGADDRTAAVARRAAWAGLLGFAIVPVVHFSVVWWRTLHQGPTVLAPPSQGVPPIDPRMAVALALAVVAATALALWAFSLRLAQLSSPRHRVPTSTPTAAGSAPLSASEPTLATVGSAEPARAPQPVPDREPAVVPYRP